MNYISLKLHRILNLEKMSFARWIRVLSCVGSFLKSVCNIFRLMVGREDKELSGKDAETSRTWPHGDSRSGEVTHRPFLFLPGKGHIWALKGHGSAPSEKNSLHLSCPLYRDQW